MLNKFVVKLIKKLYFAKIKLIVILLSLKKKNHLGSILFYWVPLDLFEIFFTLKKVLKEILNWPSCD